MNYIKRFQDLENPALGHSNDIKLIQIQDIILFGNFVKIDDETPLPVYVNQLEMLTLLCNLRCLINRFIDL